MSANYSEDLIMTLLKQNDFKVSITGKGEPKTVYISKLLDVVETRAEKVNSQVVIDWFTEIAIGGDVDGTPVNLKGMTIRRLI